MSDGPGTLTVTARPTGTALQQPGPSPSSYGQPVAMTVVVNSDLGVPTGSVTLFDGSSSLTATELSSGRATFTVSTLSAGTHVLRAQYAGLGGFASSGSATVSHAVVPANILEAVS